MIDLIVAMSGPRHCGWCIQRENVIDRWAGGYDQTRLQRLVWWLYADVSYRLGIWKLGQRWHWRYHPPKLPRQP